VLLELPPGDPRSAQAHLFLGEAQLALGSNLEAAREFRKVSDDTPNDPLAPEALLRAGDAYADLWRKPELDPSYGQTALATYQELLNRYPGGTPAKRAQERIEALQERFAYKEYRSALYYMRLKAYDSAILYLKDLVATYPRSKVAPDALIRLVQAYRTLGYKEDVAETCGYIRRFHSGAPGAGKACPADPAAS
jgi:outer membrane protein assembly factor BamD